MTVASAVDYFSVRCIAGDDFKFSAPDACGDECYRPTCGGRSYNPSTLFCEGSYVYYLCGGKSYNTGTEYCDDNKVVPK
ncbi:hypothetical protein R83H12_02881 [Fibrobacteria bacterium R8-3-H12]